MFDKSDLQHVESIIGGIYNGASESHATDQSLSFYTGGHTQSTTITAEDRLLFAMFDSQAINMLRALSVASTMAPQTFMQRTSLFRLFYTGGHTQGTPITAEDRLLFAMFDSQACNMLRALSGASTMAPQPFMRRTSLFRSTPAATLKARQ